MQSTVGLLASTLCSLGLVLFFVLRIDLTTAILNDPHKNCVSVQIQTKFSLMFINHKASLWFRKKWCPGQRDSKAHTPLFACPQHTHMDTLNSCFLPETLQWNFIVRLNCINILSCVLAPFSRSPSLPLPFVYTPLVHTDTQLSLSYSHVDRDDSWNHSLTGWPSTTILSLSFKCLHLTLSMSNYLKSLPRGHSCSISISGCCAFFRTKFKKMKWDSGFSQIGFPTVVI